jgi:hypothetical protein
MTTIPDKYLNTNVRAMISGGIEESEESEPEDQQPILHLNKMISCFKKKYRLEVSLFKEDTQGEST